MKPRFGLQTQFLLVLAAGLVVVAVLVGLVMHRQQRMQVAVEGLSGAAMQAMAGESLRRRGEGTVSHLAESLAAPVQRFDLDAIGELGQATLRQPGTRYVIVFDPQGNVLHGGNGGAPDYGERMEDPMAQEAVEAQALHTQLSDSTMDVSAPILIGRERIGGVRVGYDLSAMHGHRETALAGLRAQLTELGRNNLSWLALLAAGLLLLGAGVLWLVQRRLVRPIRQLADSARAIEAGRFDTQLPASARRDELGDLMRAFARMRESVARHDRDIRRMAYTDALTGLPNRLAFRDALDQRLLRLRGGNRHLALLFADVDDFKRINDTLGHEAGDDVLLQLSQRTRATVERLGGEDAMLARFGGDEFVILVETDAAAGDIRLIATRLAEALVEELGAPLLVHDREVFLGTSIGVTLFPQDGVSATALMKNGDIAMYQAKVADKNCFRFYSRAMDQAVERRMHLEQELRGAWDRGELSLVYQPFHRLSDGALVGAETLLRWKHPEQGMIAPSVFIDVAEQSGLIETIGPQVLRAACHDAMRWRQARDGADPLFVSVNVSPRQLRNGDLPRLVADCLGESGLAAEQLHIELTETAVIGDEAHASRLLGRLRASGVQVWLDDFGTGFSGLSHLRRVPVDGVKIDRSFIADIQRDPDDLALTTAIIAMAHSLGITVVAEGVEKEGQYDMLRDRGCDLAQGYWLGHPLPVEEFLDLLRPEPLPV